MSVSTLALLACLATSAPSVAQALPAGATIVARQGKKVLVNFDEEELVKVVKRISKITGRNFIVDRGATHRRLTIISSTPVSSEDAYNAFLDALQGAELEVVERGNFYHIRKKDTHSDRAESSTGCPPVEGIEKTGEHSFRIPKKTGELFDRPRCALVQVRVVPYFKDGKPDGFKIFAIKKDSLWAKLGFHNGDIIQSVNGMKITSPDKALGAYQTFKSADKIEVAILRRGEPIKFTYILK